MDPTLLPRIRTALDDYAVWLAAYGEVSQDHQDFFASPVGRAAKNLYYRQKLLGTAAVLPMIFCEAFLPWTRRFFYPAMRLPIADAHFAMGFALLHRVTGKPEHLDRARHFLDVLRETRCKDWKHAGWGYPFSWQTSGGIIKTGTPLITTTPYCYEAFEYVHRIDGSADTRDMLRSIAEHTYHDYDNVETGPGAASCSYIPGEGHRVVNASSYRAFTLAAAWREFGEERYWQAAQPNINFVLQSQRPDGSWYYAMDGKREFIDHFHTCFVMKGLAKAEKLAGGHDGIRQALDRGMEYYLKNLFDEEGMPKPFAKAPRLTVYRNELYDCAECLNLGSLLRHRYPALDKVTDHVTATLLAKWRKSDGSFRSRKLHLGWDNVPMHRWGQSEIFRSLALLAANANGHEPIPSK